ncbi:hypothetical protein AnigIFM62618_010513 [Aspergillus niger]|nr:hypothetical protein AnigIFM62618_010513 [Aspergillus niger]
MGILGMISEAIIAVNSLLQLTKDKSGNGIHVFLLDARRYILKFTQIVDIAPLQLYSSGLIFAPHKALIRENFKKELPAWLSRGPKVEEYWDPEMQTLEGHSRSVYSVAFSGNGQLLASGSRDKTIKLWDVATGALKHTLEGHSDWVHSVAFSGNGQLLVSGSRDKTIKLWDAATGALKHTLEGHSGWVCSVAFSGNGQLLASGSRDKTIKLWDAATGALKHDISTDDVATDVEFSDHLPLLITNLGSFDIRNYYESFSTSSDKVMEISLSAGRWVTVQGQKELWLPPNYESFLSTVKNSTIALGSTSGRVAIIAFSVM